MYNGYKQDLAARSTDAKDVVSDKKVLTAEKFSALYAESYFKLISNLERKFDLDEDTASNIIGDEFLKLKEKARAGKLYVQGNDYGSVKGLFFRSANNKVLDQLRRKKPKKNSKETIYVDPHSLTLKRHSVSIDFDERARASSEALQKKLQRILPEEQYNVLYKRHFLNPGLSFKEIAEEDGESINTELGRMRYALTALRKHPEIIDLLEEHCFFTKEDLAAYDSYEKDEETNTDTAFRLGLGGI